METIDKQPQDYSEKDLPELLTRMRAGNLKLVRTLLANKNLPNDEYQVFSERWHAALDKLKALADRAGELGYHDCMFKVGDKRLQKCLGDTEDVRCWVCTSDIEYWKEEQEEFMTPRDPKKPEQSRMVG